MSKKTSTLRYLRLVSVAELFNLNPLFPGCGVFMKKFVLSILPSLLLAVAMVAAAGDRPAGADTTLGPFAVS
jgi:hypothetical protein